MTVNRVSSGSAPQTGGVGYQQGVERQNGSDRRTGAVSSSGESLTRHLHHVAHHAAGGAVLGIQSDENSRPLEAETLTRAANNYENAVNELKALWEQYKEAEENLKRYKAVHNSGSIGVSYSKEWELELEKELKTAIKRLSVQVALVDAFEAEVDRAKAISRQLPGKRKGYISPETDEKLSRAEEVKKVPMENAREIIKSLEPPPSRKLFPWW